MKKMSIILLFSVLLSIFCPIKGRTERCVYWGNVALTTPNEGLWLKKAQDNLMFCRYYTDETLIHEKHIYFASLYGDQIVVWYGKSMNHPADICLYNLNGNFICGYYVQFSLGNGVFNMFVDENILYIYMSNTNCAYCFCPDKTEFYYIQPEYTGYIYEYHQPNLQEVNWNVKYSKEKVFLFNGESCQIQIYNHNTSNNEGETKDEVRSGINTIYILLASFMIILICYYIIKYT